MEDKSLEILVKKLEAIEKAIRLLNDRVESLEETQDADSFGPMNGPIFRDGLGNYDRIPSSDHGTIIDCNSGQVIQRGWDKIIVTNGMYQVFSDGNLRTYPVESVRIERPRP